MSKIYKCVCGREFTNPQSFNGHKANCKEHHLQKYGDLKTLNKVREAGLIGLNRGNENRQKKSTFRKACL